jgi:hypothetical protein
MIQCRILHHLPQSFPRPSAVQQLPLHVVEGYYVKKLRGSAGYLLTFPYFYPYMYLWLDFGNVPTLFFFLLSIYKYKINGDIIVPVPPLYMLLDLLILIISVTYYINTSFHATYILCIQSCVLIINRSSSMYKEGTGTMISPFILYLYSKLH